ncbi:hypothetical protein AKJ16_DCAP03576 [Drosera capensis]
MNLWRLEPRDIVFLLRIQTLPVDLAPKSELRRRLRIRLEPHGIVIFFSSGIECPWDSLIAAYDDPDESCGGQTQVFPLPGTSRIWSSREDGL